MLNRLLLFSVFSVAVWVLMPRTPALSADNSTTAGKTSWTNDNETPVLTPDAIANQNPQNIVVEESPGLLPRSRKFRSSRKIARPQDRQIQGMAASLPAGIDQNDLPRGAVDRAIVAKAMQDLAAAWNTPNLDSMLDRNFVDKSRLEDTLLQAVPRDAELRVLGMRGINTLRQDFRVLPNGNLLRTSIVSVITDTQTEFDDPVQGFQRLDGVQEYVFRIEEEFE
jgi:hypothetical protein